LSRPQFLTEQQLQFLVDKVVEAVGEKRKYVAQVNLKRRWGSAALVWDYLRGNTNRRKIEFGSYHASLWFHSPEKRPELIRTIVEEIAHFKVEVRRYKNKLIPRHKFHTKRFFRVKEKLLERLHPHMQEILNLDLSAIQPPPAKPKPTKREILQKKLAEVHKHIKRTQTRIKRLNTSLKKWKRKEKYYQKQLSLG